MRPQNPDESSSDADLTDEEKPKDRKERLQREATSKFNNEFFDVSKEEKQLSDAEARAEYTSDSDASNFNADMYMSVYYS